MAFEVNLGKYDNHGYDPGASLVKRLIWYYCNLLIFKSSLILSSYLKVKILRLFGASIGRGVVIKPSVNIKYPWFLTMGDNVWIGEDCWIDNLATVSIESNVCISQGAYLLTGNHDYKDTSFRLMVKNIVLDNGCWVGAKAIVCPGVKVGKNVVLTVGSVLVTDAEDDMVYQGNPAKPVRRRISKD